MGYATKDDFTLDHWLRHNNICIERRVPGGAAATPMNKTTEKIMAHFHSASAVSHNGERSSLSRPAIVQRAMVDGASGGHDEPVGLRIDFDFPGMSCQIGQSELTARTE